MREDKGKAFSLRLKGYSYNEINRILGVPKSTLSDWLANLVLSKEAQIRIKRRTREGSLNGLIKRNRMQTHLARQRAAEIRKTARAEISSISNKELLLLGTALYWAEGYKKMQVRNGRELTSHTISFTNADPSMVKLFIQFLNKSLNIEASRIRACVRIYQHLNEEKVLKYWQNITGLSRDTFRKFYYGVSKSSLNKRPYNRLPYGTIQIEVGDTPKFHKIMGLIEGIAKFFK